jgi:hypothetical protein
MNCAVTGRVKNEIIIRARPLISPEKAIFNETREQKGSGGQPRSRIFEIMRSCCFFSRSIGKFFYQRRRNGLSSCQINDQGALCDRMEER